MSENTKPDGGPAFPTVEADDPRVRTEPGMTLRDYFAAKALPGLISESVPAGDYSTAAAMAADVGGRNTVAEIFACAAYQIADAMIAARGAA